MTDPLREIAGVRQVPGEPRRRWFASDTMDLVVWQERDGRISSFQLCYDKPRAERAVTWHEAGERLSHMAVDDGETPGLGHKATPVLVADGALDAPTVRAAFLAAAGELPPAIVQAVLAQLGAPPVRAIDPDGGGRWSR